MDFVDREKDVALDDSSSGPKRTYSSPRVTKHGTVVQLTQGIGGSNFDPGQNNNTKVGGGVVP